MTNINVTNFRKDIYELLKQTIMFNEPINITTKDGNAVVISEEDYNALMETLYLNSIPGLKEEILEAAKEPFEECISIEEVDL